MDFEWDRDKARRNLQKHGVSFEEATSVFYDNLALEMSDPEHSKREERFLILGQAGLGRVLAVSFIERGGRIRIISARQATKRERKRYEEEN